MKAALITAVSALTGIVTAASQFAKMGRLIPPFEETDEFPFAVATASDRAVNVTGSSFFTQLLDHDDPSKGTFQQKFWWNSQYWAGPGSPVCLREGICGASANRCRLSSLLQVKLRLQIMEDT